jgi:3-oxoacyl-ACP reductase-like protein
MGIFDKVLSTLGFGKAKAAEPAPTTPPPAVTETAAAAPAPAPAAPAAPPAPAPIEVVDVVAQLEERAAKNPEKLNWRTSIVDLLKLLGIDSSLTARKELAHELGIPSELMADSAKMNMWLHKTVLARIAANGGNVPTDLLD